MRCNRRHRSVAIVILLSDFIYENVVLRYRCYTANSGNEC